MTNPSNVNIDGHAVPSDAVDLFFDGRTGERVSDAEWDESKARRLAAEALEGADAVTWQPLGGAS